jgi:N-acetylmuramoyl-L-alanine amidase
MVVVAVLAVGAGLSAAAAAGGRGTDRKDQDQRAPMGPAAAGATTSETGTSTSGSPERKPATTTTTAPAPLAGDIVGIDPGHNGRNYTDPSYIDQTVWNGREDEACDTTGTETSSGYTEAQFNFNVAQYLTADLEAEGAQVVLTRTSNTGVGPCITQRAQIIDNAHADVAIDIHADGGPVTGRGFAVLEPVADGTNDSVIAPSEAFGEDVRTVFLSVTGMPVSTYDGTDGIVYRDDLAGLNLTTVPKVLIECGNMQNATDAALLVTTTFQRQAATALAQAITEFLAGTGVEPTG